MGKILEFGVVMVRFQFQFRLSAVDASDRRTVGGRPGAVPSRAAVRGAPRGRAWCRQNGVTRRGKKAKENEFSVCSANSTLLSTANFCVQRTCFFLRK